MFLLPTSWHPPPPDRRTAREHGMGQLANLEVGGTKGKVLTTSVAQIHVDFGLAVEAVKNVDYDVMDLDAAGAFEDSYQTFRFGFDVCLFFSVMKCRRRKVAL